MNSRHFKKHHGRHLERAHLITFREVGERATHLVVCKLLMYRHVALNWGTPDSGPGPEPVPILSFPWVNGASPSTWEPLQNPSMSPQ